MPWNEADRAKYEVIRDRYSTDMSDAEFELISPLLPAPKRRGRKPTDSREILNAVFYMIRVWLSVAAVAQGFSAVHDGAEPILRLARQRTMDANRLRARDGRARGRGPRGRADGRRRRQPVGQDDGSRRAARLRRRQENQGPQTTCRRRYARPADRMSDHARRHVRIATRWRPSCARCIARARW